MIAPLLAAAVALAVGLPIFALGERIRERKERRIDSQHISPDGKDFS